MTERVFIWTEDKVIALRELAAQNLSGSQIAERIGAMSRSAVISKAGRLGVTLNGRAVTGEATAERHKAARERRNVARREKRLLRPIDKPLAKQKPRAVKEPLAPSLPSLDVSLFALSEGLCRWPTRRDGEGGWLFCGNSADPDESYCPHHYRIAYLSASRLREAAE